MNTIKFQFVPTFNLNDPTNPANYHDVGFLEGMPLNWEDEVSGRLRAIVLAYLEQKIEPSALHILIAYVQHHIHAPCWLEKSPFSEGVDEETATEIQALRAVSLNLKTVEDVNNYVDRAMEIALDPF